jgi:methionyl-tRNA formyltransferase
VERAIMAGDARTGVSIMRLTAGLDSGPVCLTESLPIEPQDTYGSVAERLQALGGNLIVRTLDEAAHGRPLPFAEQAHAGVTYAEKIGPEDRLLDPARPAQELERVVRALHPHIGARLQLADGGLLGVHEARIAGSQQGEDGPPPGELAAGELAGRGDRLLYGTARGALELLRVQPPGARPMDAGAYLRGHAV